MTVPTFRNIPSPAEIKNVDWTDGKAAVAFIKDLGTDLKFNTDARTQYLTSLQASAETLVKDLENAVASMNSMSKRGAVQLPKVDELKDKRTEVKALMNEVSACDRVFFAAVGGFRGASNFELPEKYETVVQKLRGATQTADKKLAGVTHVLGALEARASAALKAVNAGMGNYEDDAKTISKMTDMLTKLTVMQGNAVTASTRIGSSCGFVAKNMSSKDKKISGLCEVKSSEIAKEATVARQSQVAVKAGVTSIASMHDSLVDAGMKTNQGKPIVDDAKQRLIDVLTNMSEAQKVLAGLLKDKNLPKTLKSLLPSSVT